MKKTLLMKFRSPPGVVLSFWHIWYGLPILEEQKPNM